MQAQNNDDPPRNLAEQNFVGQQERADRTGRGAQHHEDGGKTGNEGQRANCNPFLNKARVRTLRCQIIVRGASNKREISRHQWQYTRRQKRHDTADQGGQKACVKSVHSTLLLNRGNRLCVTQFAVPLKEHKLTNW